MRNDVAQRMLEPLDHTHSLAMPQHRCAVSLGDPHEARVRRLPEQAKHRARAGAQDPLSIIDCFGVASSASAIRLIGVYAGCAVDVRHDARGQILDDAARARRALVFFRSPAADPARVASQHVLQSDRLAETHVHFAELLPQRRQRAQHAEHRFLLLRLAGQFADIGLALHEPLVAEVHGHEHDRSSRIAQVTAHGHGQHAGLRLQQLPVRLRPPSMKYSIACPRAIMSPRYFMKTIV